MLEIIQKNIENFSKSERKVAEIILINPQTAIHSSIAILAKQADVSEPTVNRFCRRLDTKGYPDFKLQLAQSLALSTPYVNRHVEEEDTADAYTAKIFESTMACIDSVKNTIDIQQINRAVDLLTQAKKIAFFALGASSAAALDAQNKFIRFNIPILYFNDVVMQQMSCVQSCESDVVVLISHTGRTKSLIDLALLAKQNGATVIGITQQGSPLDEVCSLTIQLNTPEDPDIYMPMSSRIVQMTVIDVLATGFTLRRGAGFRENLKRVKDVINDSRLQRETGN